VTWTGGLYVHVPFCATVCPYCDFAVVAGRRNQHAAYMAALVEEARASEAFTATSLFVGGGTPSFVDPGLLGATLRDLRTRFAVADDAEITIECNPETTTSASLCALPGVNRVSIGAQSFDPVVLRALGRTHAPEHIARAVEEARAAGIRNVSVDLIYGTAEETDASWEATLRAAVALQPEHISAYSLQIEEGTPFGTAVARGTMAQPDEDLLASRFETACAILREAGYEHYEVSNWSIPGYASRHNLTYWTQGDYLGLGLGAHSHRAGHRWWNTRDLAAYLKDPTAAVVGDERLDDAARAEEWVMLRVRLTEPIPLAEAEARLDGDDLHLTERGLLLGNHVAAMLTSRSLQAP
jgi:putative oxygen-independent coproporphyrinogen III oxidase